MILFINYLSEKLINIIYRVFSERYIIFFKAKINIIKFKDLNFCKDNFIDKKINIIKFKDSDFDQNIFLIK